MSQGLAYTTQGIGGFVYNTGDENFYPLTLNSGGVVVSALYTPTHSKATIGWMIRVFNNS